MTRDEKPLRIINSIAPIRICDNGGWTDTWFAEYGSIFNIGVSPHAEVQIEVYPRHRREAQITLFAENYGERFTVQLNRDTWDRHPLLEAAIERMGVPDDLAVHISLYSEAPAGASIGTSAAVTVALVGALDVLTPGKLTPHEVAYTAQSIEVDMLHRQCGIQDQLCAAYGGINYIEMFQYPHASVSQLQLSNALWWELNRRLVLIYLGSSHDSSQVHEQVIRGLEGAGAECEPLRRLRTTAARSRDAVYAGDWQALGQAMTDNTRMQQDLHPALLSDDAHQVIEIARAHGALGWKMNGAGGEGGSVTLLCGESSHQQRSMLQAIGAASPLFQPVPIHLSRYGLFVWETSAR
jgi:D-glycero-alpha-D-manno-heptose-7-phosphate kinase